jgi:GTP pyrophosphokinase
MLCHAPVQIRARTKSMFSVMKKLLQLSSAQGRGKTRQDIYDLHGLRAVVQPRTDLPPEQAEQAAQQACYRLQQLAEMVWAPLQQRSKDYISQPKANGYRSMHLTLAVPSEQASASSSSCSSDEEEQLASRINSNSQASSSSSSSSKAAQQQQQPNYESWLSGPLYVELQIRTQLMDEQAEMGAAAHAGYKGGLDARQAQQLQSWTQELQRRLLLQPQQKLQLPVRPISGLPAAAAEAAEGEAGSDPAAAWAAAEGLFRHLDRDGDGRLSLNELQLVSVWKPAFGAALPGWCAWLSSIVQHY